MCRESRSGSSGSRACLGWRAWLASRHPRRPSSRRSRRLPRASRPAGAVDLALRVAAAARGLVWAGGPGWHPAIRAARHPAGRGDCPEWRTKLRMRTTVSTDSDSPDSSRGCRCCLAAGGTGNGIRRGRVIEAVVGAQNCECGPRYLQTRIVRTRAGVAVVALPPVARALGSVDTVTPVSRRRAWLGPAQWPPDPRRYRRLAAGTRRHPGPRGEPHWAVSTRSRRCHAVEHGLVLPSGPLIHGGTGGLCSASGDTT